jgi:small subunit ribosomal protein S13
MARISGVDIPDNKRGEIALTYIFGLGRRSSAQMILDQAEISRDKKVKDWTDDEANKVRSIISVKTSKWKVF